MIRRGGNGSLPEFVGLLRKGPLVVQETLSTIQFLENRTVKHNTKCLFQGLNVWKQGFITMWECLPSLGGSAFSSGHDRRVLGSTPASGSLLCGKPASPSPSACHSSCLCSLSLCQINEILKKGKKEKKRKECLLWTAYR